MITVILVWLKNNVVCLYCLFIFCFFKNQKQKWINSLHLNKKCTQETQKFHQMSWKLNMFKASKHLSSTPYCKVVIEAGFTLWLKKSRNRWHDIDFLWLFWFWILIFQNVCHHKSLVKTPGMIKSFLLLQKSQFGCSNSTVVCRVGPGFKHSSNSQDVQHF